MWEPSAELYTAIRINGETQAPTDAQFRKIAANAIVSIATSLEQIAYDANRLL